MKRAPALMVLLLLAAAGTASADTIKVTFKDGIYVEKSLGGSSWSGTTAGQVLLQLNPTEGPTFWGFCVDLLHWYGNESTVPLESPGLDLMSTWNIPPYGGSPSTPGIRAAYLFRRYAGNTDLENNFAAALQVAIWEVLFETSGTYNVLSGNVAFRNGSMLTAAQAILDDNANFGDADAIWVRTQNNTANDYHQDFMIPEPGSLLLLGAGLLGLATAVRGRR